MQLHEIRKIRKGSKRRRIARGGKRGTYSGRGQKGQKSRAGRRIRPSERDLILRLPKRRGFRNKPLAARPVIVNLKELERFSGTVDRGTFVEAGIIKKRDRRGVKILGGGEIAKPLTVKGISVSKSAKMKIEAAGGRVE